MLLKRRFDIIVPVPKLVPVGSYEQNVFNFILENTLVWSFGIIVVVVVYRSEDGDRDSKNGDLDMPVDPNEPTYCICEKVVVCLFVC